MTFPEYPGVISSGAIDIQFHTSDALTFGNIL
jgi:hypothetical protein